MAYGDDPYAPRPIVQPYVPTGYDPRAGSLPYQTVDGNVAQRSIDAISQWGPGMQFDPQRWGGQVAGAEQDVARYRALGAQGYAAPTIDQGQSNETRGFALGSLGMLGNVANGGATRVDALGNQLAEQGQNQLYGMAASVRGGPMARAAAMRAAQQNAGANMQRAQAQIAAGHAANMASARGAYMDAASGLRNQDIGLASAQADLEAQNRALNAQRQQGYEKLGYDVQNADLGAQIGRTAAEQAAANTARSQAMAEDAASAQRFKDVATAGVGAATGLASGIGKLTADGQPKASDDPWATSDERAKDAGGYVSNMADANRSMAPHAYVYKPGYAEQAGQRYGEPNVGPMAQAMARSPVASTAIVQRPDGMLAIDKDKALKLTMGGLASLQHQVDDLRRKR